MPSMNSNGNTPSNPPTPPVKLYALRDIPVPEFIEPTTSGWQQGVPIIIDLGSYHTRIGYSSESNPSHSFPTQWTKYRDRKSNKTYTLVGNDAYLDTNGRHNIRSPFDGSFISHWEGLETILDYSLSKISVESIGNVNNPLVVSEMLGCPSSQRKSLNELLFEAYKVPSVAYGIDSLFAFKYNKGTDGLVISTGHEATHIIPVLNGRGVLSMAKRVNWGGRQASSFLQSLLSLKYPQFPTKLSLSQANLMVHDHCYVSLNYAEEISSMLRFEGLEDRERIIQTPFTEVVIQEKTEEELARITEKRKESGRRLQEQAAKQRLEKLVQKESDLEYYRKLQEKLAATAKKDLRKVLDSEGFKDEAALQKTVNELVKAIKRSRKEDVGEDEPAEPMTFPLVDIPDEELSSDQIKEKRKQRLFKANYDARIRAKEEKVLEKKRLEEEEKKDEDWRAQDLEGWIKDRRDKLDGLISKVRERKRLKEELSNRKSRASQMRMKSIAALASDTGRRKRRRGKGDDDADDTFGADDSDWAVYRDIANASDTEEDEEEQKEIKKLEEQLLTHDSTFIVRDQEEEVTVDWRQNVVHMFLRGPHEYDPESLAQNHQLNLNIERIRVPEVVFQPSIAGVDQAGIVEIAKDILNNRYNHEINSNLLNDIFLTGGQAHFLNFDQRLRNDLRTVLPVDAPIKVRIANNPDLDAWKGMAAWANTSELKQSSISRQDYEEMGSEYLKEHGLGNDYI